MTPERWKQVEALYHATRTRPLREREAFLAAACSADEALRREVESLLNEDVSEEGFLDRPALARAAGMTTTMAPASWAGRALGSYRLESLIGSGGMGEVYRAHDAKLGRDVAIKILPRAFTSDRDRLTRFEREARMLAALNHPNICAIYGLEESDGIKFLVLELVEGETLADALATVERAPGGGAGLPLPRALSVARQIADALNVAHGKGIVHRDLKPANIKITPGGVVKVLDFGLAKIAADAETVAGPLDTSAVPQHHTQLGIVVGTPAYMSPEQARALPIDARTDIWAFGCVLYEMLTGRVTFAGDTAPDAVTKILDREPDWSVVPATIPDPIRKLLFGCLTNDPNARWREIGTVMTTIDEAIARSSARAGLRVRRLVWAIVALLAVGLVGLAAWGLGKAKTPPASVLRFAIQLPAGQELDPSGGAHMMALSPDGKRMAYVARPNLLSLRVMENPDVTPIPDTQQYVGVREPVFSPDGLSIAFYAFNDSTIKRMSISGGAAVKICDADTPFGMNWGPAGIVFGQGAKGVWLVSPEADSTPVQIATVRGDERAHGPQILPDGQHVIFTLATGDLHGRWDKARIVVQRFPSGDAERKALITGSDARYLPTGELFYAISGQLYAVPFDAGRLETTGAPVSIVSTGISRAAGAFTGAAQYSFSTSGGGMFVYVPGPVLDSESAPTDVALLDLKGPGDPEPLGLPPGAYQMPRVSPDDKFIAVVNDDDKDHAKEIWVRGLKSDLPPRPLTNAGNNRFAAWTRDGRRIAFQSDREGDRGMFWQAAEGGDPAARLGPVPARGESYEPESWSPTSDTLLFSKAKDGVWSLWTYSVADGRESPFGNVHSSAPTSATFSPDGKWVAYTMRKAGITIEVQPFPATGAVYPLVAQGSDSPKHARWWRSADALVYDPRPIAFEAVDVALRPQFAFGAVRLLPHRFQGAPPGSRTPYDVTRDGKLVGMITWGQRDYGRGPLDQIQVTAGWFEWLNGRLSR